MNGTKAATPYLKGRVVNEVKKVMSKKFVVVALSLMALAGCASYPEPVRIADNVALTSYENATQQNIDFGTARWSGVIAEISNQSQSNPSGGLCISCQALMVVRLCLIKLRAVL